MSDDERQPIGQVLPDFKLHPLEPGWTPLQAFVLVKSLDEEGGTAWSFRTSEQFNLEELLGALVVRWKRSRESSRSRGKTRIPTRLRTESGAAPRAGKSRICR